MSERKRFVRNRTDRPVFVPGVGVVPAKATVEVTDSDAVKEAVEQKVLAEAKAADVADNDENKEGGQ